MKLTQEEYKDLEQIVGPEYITQEPVIMESYNQIWGNKLAFGDKRAPLKLQTQVDPKGEFKIS